MSGDGGRTTLPVGFGTVIAAIRKRDVETLAQEIFESLDYQGPVAVPPALSFSDPKLLERWRRGETAIPPELTDEFTRWLEWTRRRGNAIEENARRLRATTWAQMRLKNVGDYWEHFERFHRERWGIVRVCEDDEERELQVRAVAKNGGGLLR